MRNVLIVEPDKSQAAAFAGQFEKLGFSCTVCPEGAEALTSLEWGRPDIIVCAAVLSDMMGSDLCEIARSDPATASALFIMLGRTGDSARTAGDGVGPDAVMPRRPSARALVELAVLSLGDQLPDRVRNTPAARSKSPDASQFRGSLAVLEFPDLLQTLSSRLRDGHLTVTFAGESGSLYFLQGRLIHAKFGEARGVEAVESLFERAQHGGGEFDFLPCDTKGTEVTIQMGMDHLLLDVAARFDEDRAGKSGIGCT